MSGRFVRLAEADRPRLTIRVDGQPVEVLAGDTLIVAVLASGRVLRTSEFRDGRRAGFCVMGACQDCWVWTDEGGKLRSCSVEAADGMSISTSEPEATWPNLA